MVSAILNKKTLLRSSSGFTLLEVMIAVAVLSISLVALFGAQSHSLSLATEAQFNTIAAMLAQEKIAEIEAGLLPYSNDRGDFGKKYPGYEWSLEVSASHLEGVDFLNALDKILYKVKLSVAQTEGVLSYTTIYYGRERKGGEQAYVP